MPKVEVSVGELLDKYSILTLKEKFLAQISKANNVRNEKQSLQNESEKYIEVATVKELYDELMEVNLKIWNGMDEIFKIGNSPNSDFEKITRLVTNWNMERSFIKKKINLECKSELTEEKSYF